MIVTLTHYQARSVMRRVSDLHASAMREHWRRAGRTQRDYDLPAIAWRQILDELQASCFGPRGGRLDRGVPKSAYAAIKRIATGVGAMEAHPAWREAGARGWLGTVLPGWAYAGGRRGPYPERDMGQMHFALMTPEHITLHGLEVTVWVSRPPEPIGRSWTFGPDSHMLFVGRSAAPESAEPELSEDDLPVEDLVVRETFG